MSKICKQCGEEKPLQDFGSVSRNKDGHSGTCKTCRCQNLAEWRQKILSSESSKKCARCGIEKPMGEFSNHPSYCRECRRALDREYDQKPVRREYKRQNCREWRRRNREHVAEYKRQRLLNPETRKAERKAANIRGRRYYANNKEKCFDHAARRRARIKGAYEEKVDRLAIAERDNWTCHICGKKVSRKDMSLDHLIPIAKGGKHCASNVKLAHLQCNRQRGTGKIPAQLLLF